jgi:hypothetical protein
MTAPVFPRTTIAAIWDFDKTLVPDYMQKPLFAHYGVDEAVFWAEVRGLPQFYRQRKLDLVSKDTLYLNHILAYVRAGRFAGLNNDMLVSFGAQLTFYQGLPDFFPALKRRIEQNPLYAKHGITIEHYIVSTGLRKIIQGSAIAEHVNGIWACEFGEQTAPPGYLNDAEQLIAGEAEIVDIGYMIDNTTKTRAVFEINKGVNVFPEQIDVNSNIAPEDRRIPFEHMIYIADGPSDIPVFSILNQYGGRTYAVYQPGNEAEFVQVANLQEQRRVQGIGKADYRAGEQTSLWITNAAERIADRIVRAREDALGDAANRPPEHIVQEPQAAPAAPPADLGIPPRPGEGATEAGAA